MTKKTIGPECANCSLAGSTMLACGRCVAVNYCSKMCQQQHWHKGAHKKHCISVEQRNPRHQLPIVGQKHNSQSEECAICHDILLSKEATKLPCGHSYHADCVTELRKFGSEVCPLCRADLPPGPDKRCNNAMRRCLALIKHSFGPKSEEMQEILQTWRLLSDGEDHAQSQFCPASPSCSKKAAVLNVATPTWLFG